ncbi:unnamed protein product [Penicillium glandicola]
MSLQVHSVRPALETESSQPDFLAQTIFSVRVPFESTFPPGTRPLDVTGAILSALSLTVKAVSPAFLSASMTALAMGDKYVYSTKPSCDTGYEHKRTASASPPSLLPSYEDHSEGHPLRSRKGCKIRGWIYSARQRLCFLKTNPLPFHWRAFQWKVDYISGRAKIPDGAK